MEISVQVDISEALRGLDALEKDVERATVAALNRVAVTARAVAARSISKQSGLPVNQVRERVPLVRANRHTLQAKISATPYAPNLIRYSARQTKTGVSANAWRQRKVYPGTFIGNQGRTVFKRTGKARLPIQSVYGPSVPRTFIRDETMTAITGTIETRFPLEFSRAFAALARRK